MPWNQACCWNRRRRKEERRGEKEQGKKKKPTFEKQKLSSSYLGLDRLRRSQHLDKPSRPVPSNVDVVRLREVPVERGRVELRERVDLVDAFDGLMKKRKRFFSRVFRRGREVSFSFVLFPPRSRRIVSLSSLPPSFKGRRSFNFKSRTGIDAVGDGDVDQAVVGAEWHRGLGALLCERVQAGTRSAAEDDAEHGLFVFFWF